MFITNNHPLFLFFWKKNLMKHWKVSDYYEIDCVKIFLLLFKFLLTTIFVTNSHIYARTFFNFLKTVFKQTSNSFNTKLQRQWNDRKSRYQERQLLGFFVHLIGLSSRSNSAKGLRVTKNVQKIKLEKVWGDLQSKTIVSAENNSQNIWH